MSTNIQKLKRKTKHIRVRLDLHSAIKFRAVLERITISKLLDQILEDYLKSVQAEPKQ